MAVTLARLPSNIVLDVDEVSQTIDKSWLKGINDSETIEAIGQATIDFIRERAAKGLGLGGEALKPTTYSESYQNSSAFKAAGKSKSPVNMLLSGDMLSSIDLVVDGDKLLIGLPSDQSPKAHGHMTGQQGKGPLPKRQFFGVTKTEFDSIVSKFNNPKKDEKKIKTNTKNKTEKNKSESVTQSENEIFDFIKEIGTLGDLFRLIP